MAEVSRVGLAASLVVRRGGVAANRCSSVFTNRARHGWHTYILRLGRRDGGPAPHDLIPFPTDQRLRINLKAEERAKTVVLQRFQMYCAGQKTWSKVA